MDQLAIQKWSCGQIGLCTPQQKLESVCVDKKACVGYVSGKKCPYGQIDLCRPCQRLENIFVGKRWEMSVKSRCPCGRVCLCRLQYRKTNACLHGYVILRGLRRWKENIRVDGLVCTGHDIEKKM